MVKADSRRRGRAAAGARSTVSRSPARVTTAPGQACGETARLPEEAASAGMQGFELAEFDRPFVAGRGDGAARAGEAPPRRAVRKNCSAGQRDRAARRARAPAPARPRPRRPPPRAPRPPGAPGAPAAPAAGRRAPRVQAPASRRACRTRVKRGSRLLGSSAKAMPCLAQASRSAALSAPRAADAPAQSRRRRRAAVRRAPWRRAR